MSGSASFHASYPPAPWLMHGWSVARPYRVPVASLRLPEGLTPVARGGFALGMFGFVSYEPPSPLTYRELIWMPAFVRARRADGRALRGFYVAKMYVDHEGSLAGGREIWALPKQRARFDVSADRVAVQTEDGARLELSLGRRLPGVPFRGRVATIQPRDATLVRFRGVTERATASVRSFAVSIESSLDGTWQGFERARPLAPLGFELRGFRTVMEPPRIEARG